MVSYLDPIEGFSSICLTVSKYRQLHLQRKLSNNRNPGLSWDCLGLCLASLWLSWRTFKVPLGISQAFLAPIGTFLDLSWDCLGLSGASLWLSWDTFWLPCWHLLGLSCTSGASLVLSWACPWAQEATG